MADATTQVTTAPGLPFNDVIPGAVLESTKNGLVVAAEKLIELATYLRDQAGYDYLSMVTSVDWPQYFEVVYYLTAWRRRHGDTRRLVLERSACPTRPTRSCRR